MDLPAPAAENRGMAFRIPLLAAALAASSAGAQQAASVGSPSRDIATLTISATNSAVGRVARECLALVGRSESPEQFVTQWRQRNLRFVSASSKYLDRRLEDAGTTGGPEQREALLHNIRQAVQSDGDSLARTLLQRGRKEDACMNAVTLVDTGVLDITPKLPTYPDIESLVRWAEQ